MSKWTKDLKKYEKWMKDYHKKKKVVKEKHYSSFWWDDDWSGNSRYSGWNNDAKIGTSGDLVKMIKLSSYQRAIANFVKIVAKKDIPVIFGGKDSYTNGKRVVLASDINDKNFDVAVGLALHEASHVVLTDFEAVPKYFQEHNIPTNHWSDIKNLCNIIEDRRIDNYIFKHSPGYRAYYHKMYDHYFYDDNISIALRSGSFRDARIIKHYIFRITNMHNPMSVKDALPGLREIHDLIDLKTIGRLQSTNEVIALAQQVHDIIMMNVEKAQSDPNYKPNTKQKNNQKQNSQDGDDDQPNHKIDDSDDTDNSMGGFDTSMPDMEGKLSDQDSDSSDDADGNADGMMGNGNSSADGDGDDEGEDGPGELTQAQMEKVQKAFDKQKQFVDGEIKKKAATKNLQNQLEQVSKMDLDVQVVGDKSRSFKVIMYDLSKKLYLRNLICVAREYDKVSSDTEKREEFVKKTNAALGLKLDTNQLFIKTALDLPAFLRGNNSKEVTEGIELGSLLGRKLMVRNEERSLVYNRLVTGRIDAKRLSHAGYGMETVFKQIHTDRYKQACLHISLDLSSSMAGKKWQETVKMCSAIVKAATYVQNLRVQVSLRATTGSRGGENPFLAIAYDSKVNDLKHYIEVMGAMSPVATTPEGLCFDALMRKNLLMPSSSECTSYFLNISDGQPGMSGWGGSQAIQFTRKQVQRMKNEMGINVISFFVDNYKTDRVASFFSEMYGKDSRAVDANNVTQIARALNEKFLAEGKYTS